MSPSLTMFKTCNWHTYFLSKCFLNYLIYVLGVKKCDLTLQIVVCINYNWVHFPINTPASGIGTRGRVAKERLLLNMTKKVNK